MTHAELEQYFSWFELKSLPRTGWINNGVNNPESVASHSWGMSLLAMKLCPENLDLSKVLQICIVHDLPESIVGDITPYDGVSKDEKRKMESDAMKSVAPEFFELWKEYEDQSSEEARFVKRMDKLDMSVQAMIYKKNLAMDSETFIQSAKKYLEEEDLDLILKFAN